MHTVWSRVWMIGVVLAGGALAAAAQQQPAKQADTTAHGPQAAAPNKGETPQQFLAKRSGEWTRTIRFVGQPDAQTQSFTGTSKFTAISGGRFLLEEYNDVVSGRPITGTRLFGFNTVTGQYEAAFTGTTSPAILMLKGKSSDDGKVVDYSGESESARGDKFTLNVRVRQVDDDHIVMSFSMTGADGKPNTFQETSYARKK